jgi:hypothetical protein
MPENKYWMSRNHEKLHKQAEMTVEYLLKGTNRVRMGLSNTDTLSTPQGKWYDGEFSPKYNAYHLVFEEWEFPPTRTPILNERLRLAEAPFREVYRKLYIGLFKESPLVTDDDLLAMGLPTRHSGGNTPAPVPASHPAAEIDSSELRRLSIHFYEDRGAHRKAKPRGVHGAEIRWTVRDTSGEVHLKDLIHSSFDTHTPVIFDFEDEQRGKVFYFALRWENTRGDKGPFGPVENAIIP